jgi:hypothetical protein
MLQVELVAPVMVKEALECGFEPSGFTLTTSGPLDPLTRWKIRVAREWPARNVRPGAAPPQPEVYERTEPPSTHHVASTPEAVGEPPALRRSNCSAVQAYGPALIEVCSGTSVSEPASVIETQFPDAHARPPEHGGFIPHWQLPPTQLSADVMSQAAQALNLPHSAGVGVLHEPLTQHPAHEVESQTQLPLTHRLPGLQALDAPHWQVPVLEQLSAVTDEQTVQVSPFAPQVDSVGGMTQLLASQQPAEQVVPLQMQLPFWQR